MALSFRRRGAVAAVLTILSTIERVWSNEATCTLDGTCMGEVVAEEPVEYGVDVSYPMHHLNVSDMMGNKQEFYDSLIQGCVDHYGDQGKNCIQYEKERIEMSLRQPQSMKNYTKTGFTKIRAPESVFKLIKDFWEANKNNKKIEDWGAGYTYTNHWEMPSYMVNVEDESLEGGGHYLKQQIWNAARDTISEWTGHQLAECSLYGVRVYTEGAVLAPHVDRLPLVSSAIINVDQDVDEPWPLEVIGHDGKAHNVTMEPGDLVLYESHSILHGRPFPLKGRFMANIFIHFEPIGPLDGDVEVGKSDLPPYLIPGSPEEANWRKQNPHGHQLQSGRITPTPGTTKAHLFAGQRELDALKKVIEESVDLVNAKDANGWTPLHEAIRGGNLEIVKFLVEKGSDVNARTYPNGDGESALLLAHDTHGNDHPVSKFLENLGAKVVEPGH